MAHTAYRELHATKNGKTITLAFLDGDTLAAARVELRRAGFDVETGFSWFQIMRDADQALATALAYCD